MFLGFSWKLTKDLLFLQSRTIEILLAFCICCHQRFHILLAQSGMMRMKALLLNHLLLVMERNQHFECP